MTPAGGSIVESALNDPAAVATWALVVANVVLAGIYYLDYTKSVDRDRRYRKARCLELLEGVFLPTYRALRSDLDRFESVSDGEFPELDTSRDRNVTLVEDPHGDYAELKEQLATYERHRSDYRSTWEAARGELASEIVRFCYDHDPGYDLKRSLSTATADAATPAEMVEHHVETFATWVLEGGIDDTRSSPSPVLVDLWDHFEEDLLDRKPDAVSDGTLERLRVEAEELRSTGDGVRTWIEGVVSRYEDEYDVEVVLEPEPQ